MKTPQEKKILSYAKDRRNTFGENSKASRKNIPLAKARANREERHAQNIALFGAVVALSDDILSEVELQVKASKPRSWRKSPDSTLSEFLARRKRRTS